MMSRLIPFILLAISVGLLLGYVHPTYTGSIAELQAEIKGYEGALKAAQDFTQREAELVNQRSNIDQAGLDRLEAFLPDGVDNVQLFLDLDALAGRTGMTIQDLDVSEQSVSEDKKDGSASLGMEAPVESIELSVSASGTYPAMRAFIAGTEQSLRLLDLVDLTISESNNGVYTYDMRFRLYWLP